MEKAKSHSPKNIQTMAIWARHWVFLRSLYWLPAILLSLYEPALAQVIVYPEIPGRPLSRTYTLTAGGRPVPVQQYNGNSFAWFAFSETADVTITVSQSVSSYVLSPTRNQVPSTARGHDIQFSLNQPRKLVLNNVNGLSEQLFIFADAMEESPPVSGQAGVYNIQSYGADPTGAGSSTSAIQQAIDAANAHLGGGVAYVPAGLYTLTGNVVFKSNVHVYLSPGSVIRIGGGSYSARVAFHLSHLANARVSGRGVIDGQGSIGHVGYNQMLQTNEASNVQLEDVMFLDSYTTAVRFGMSSDSTIANVKILSASPVLSDGLDTDSVSNLTVANNFIYSSDDNIAIGAGTNVLNYNVAGPTDGIHIAGNVFHHPRTGYCCYGHILSIVPARGTASIKNITFSNNDGIWAVDVFGIYPFGGTNVDAVTYSNSSIEDAAGRLFDFAAVDCTAWGTQNCGTPIGVLGHVHNIRVSNVAVGHGRARSMLQGFSPRADVNGVTFDNLRIAGTLVTDAATGNIVIGEHVENVSYTIAEDNESQLK